MIILQKNLKTGESYVPDAMRQTVIDLMRRFLDLPGKYELKAVIDRMRKTLGKRKHWIEWKG